MVDRFLLKLSILKLKMQFICMHFPLFIDIKGKLTPRIFFFRKFTYFILLWINVLGYFLFSVYFCMEVFNHEMKTISLNLKHFTDNFLLILLIQRRYINFLICIYQFIEFYLTLNIKQFGWLHCHFWTACFKLLKIENVLSF